MELNESQLKMLSSDGYCIFEFQNKDRLKQLRILAESQFPCQPEKWHEQGKTQDEHIHTVKKLTDVLVGSKLVHELVRDNIQPFISLLGSAFDIQTAPHVRVSRPSIEEDFLDWHRDTFYGTSPWEVNIWMPLYDLPANSGLMLIPGSHKGPSRNIRVAVDQNAFRSQVSKGSEAHQVGYVYMPKTDDSIASLDPKKAVVLSPKFGSAVFFFGCSIHRAINRSENTRVSVDVRLKSMHAPTGTRPGYYTPFHRGLISQCIEGFVATEKND